MDAERFRVAAAQLGLQLLLEQVALFERFEAALYEANTTHNLTRVAREDSWNRHFLDSLLIHDLLPTGAAVLDVGAGPGFPAWPLACARPDLNVMALDSNRKMLAFLASQPLANLRVVQARAEEWKAPHPFDVVTGRAVAPFAAQLEISAGHCNIGGLVIPMRTTAERDLLDKVNLRPLGLSLVRAERRALPGTDVVRLFPIYKKVAPTHRGYPRRWAEIKQKPLLTSVRGHAK